MYDVLIIGAGPAGLSAAVYLKRAMLSVAIIEKQPLSGGQILTSYNIENYLGFTQISGTELAEKFKKHAEAAGACFIFGEVLKINKNYDLKFCDFSNRLIVNPPFHELCL